MRDGEPGHQSSASAAEELRACALSPLIDRLRCIHCGSPVVVREIVSARGYASLGPDGWLACTGCGEGYPLVGGTARMLDRAGQVEIARRYSAAEIWKTERETGGCSQDEEASLESHDDEAAVKDRTAASFAYEWKHFGALRAEWARNFRDYMRPHEPGSLSGKVVLDVGAGSGRHSAHAAASGAHVVAVDLGSSIDVARSNLPAEVLTVQADAERLPFAPGSFDFVMSIGVLHHLPDTQRALNGLVPFVIPGGHLHIYLYWLPDARWQRIVLRIVSGIRRVTVQMPHRLLHAICYPLSVILWLGIVLPCRALRQRPRTARLVRGLPLRTYADYPFGVLVNDQFDRFSAPIERRYTEIEVRGMCQNAGLSDVVMVGNYGWVADGRRTTPADRSQSGIDDITADAP